MTSAAVYELACGCSKAPLLDVIPLFDTFEDLRAAVLW